MRLVVSGCLLLAVTVALAVDDYSGYDYIGPNGLRTEHYRAPTPATVPHGKAITTEALTALVDSAKPLLLDVQAVAVRPELEEFGMSWLPNEPRYHIPGSVWLPNVGYYELTPRMDRYFRDNLRRLSGGDKTKPIVIYCVIDCWMSWNAVQRAASYGYQNLYWYRDGSDGWQEAGFELAEGEPVELVSEASEALDAVAPAAFFIENPEIDDLRQQLAVAKQAGQRGLLLFFETDECPFCERMRREVLSRDDVRRYYQTRFRALALDSLAEDVVTDFQGESLTLREFAQRDNRVRVTPTLVFIDLNGEPIHRHVGVIADPQEFLWLADYVAEEIYLERSYREFVLSKR